MDSIGNIRGSHATRIFFMVLCKVTLLTQSHELNKLLQLLEKK